MNKLVHKHNFRKESPTKDPKNTGILDGHGSEKIASTSAICL